MYISKLNLVNYRNFANAEVLFRKGTNTIIGENGSGKTNLFRAIRLLLDDTLMRSAYRLDESDFHRGLARWQGHWIIISLEFSEISADEAIQALFVHGAGALQEAVDKATYTLVFRPKTEIRLQLSELDEGDAGGLDEILSEITIADYEVKFFGKGEADFSDEETYTEIVGDFENVIFPEELHDPRIGAPIPTVLSVQKEVSFTFIQALRDVVADFRSNKTNPLYSLLKYKSGEIDPAVLAPITDKVKDLNTSIEELDDVKGVRRDIAQTIRSAAGETYSPSTLSIKSDLSDEAAELFQSLRLYIGEADDGYEGDIYELSLGGANLIYLTLKLLEFKYQRNKESFANFLLIEEPEAHIHTHIQKTLFDRLNYDETQIIYSTHSTHISEVSNVQNVNVLGRGGSGCSVCQPANGLSAEQVGSVQRYLDAVRSNLLFAKSVIMIEGDAEEILIPLMIKRVFGVSLDELGVSLINIRSTGFENVAILFHRDRIQKQCAIVTDFDAPFMDINLGEKDPPKIVFYKEKLRRSAESGAARKAAMDAFTNGNTFIEAYYAEHTFEIEFARSGENYKIVRKTIDDVYTNAKTRAIARADLASNDVALLGRRVLLMAENQGKGWFALLVGKHIDEATSIPSYILEALVFASPIVKKSLWLNILAYRLHYVDSQNMLAKPVMLQCRKALSEYRKGNIEIDELHKKFDKHLPEDPGTALLALHQE